ncbi:MAG: hypothetical protein IKB38_08695 [Clostridia bacterium]|nr:hypothetical protein [Clostridia bacterium]
MQKKKNTADPCSAYRNLDTGMSRAPKKSDSSPKGVKTVTEGDLRAPKGR